ncbi:MAG: MMPL family transporter [Thermomicrobiales bacterium]|nr:MMPL family transporter [Thermomicrobiales bacterium]
MSGLYVWLARTAFAHPWRFVGVWLVVLVVAGIGAGRAEQALDVGGFSLPGTEFHAASEILADDLDLSSDKAALVVFHSDTILATDKPFHDAVVAAMANLDADPVVSKTESFYTTGIPDMVSPDNHTSYAWVTLTGDEKTLEEATPRLRELVRSDAIETYVIGQAAAAYDVQEASAEDLVRVERFTLPIIVILLVLVFGSIVAAGIPLLLGAACVVTALATLYMLAQMTDVSIFALNTASMIGLGLAIDFSLIMISRFRDELKRLPPEQALERTLQTAGRSITFSGVTIVLTMAVLTLFPVMVIRSIALAIMLVAGISVIAGLLLLPALMALLARHLDRLNVRRFIPLLNRRREGMWAGIAHAVMGRPWISAGLALLILCLMALPALRLERQGVTVEVLPESSESRVAYELVQRQFGPGEVAPLFVVVQTGAPGSLWQPDLLQGIYDLHVHMAADPRVARVSSLASLIPNPSADWIRSLSPATIESNPDRDRIASRLADLDGDNRTTVLVVFPKTSETDPVTVELMRDLREHAITWAPGLAAANVLIGGSPAQHDDFDRVVYDQFPLLLALSLFVTFVILMVFFHSLILPLKAILLNIASLLASYGLLTLVFQDGVGDSLLGFDSLGQILSYTPVLLFSILFGLSTDYEVFVLSRVREYVRQGYSNRDAVALGLERTAGVITAAGLIMIAVFGSFALTEVLVVKELGFGLAVAILLDTTLVRIVLVPATMTLMGDWNWWMPRWLARFVPTIDEGEEEHGAPSYQPSAVSSS